MADLDAGSLAFVLASFVAAACDKFFMSKKYYLRIVVDDLGMLVPMSHRLTRWIYDWGSFQIILQTGWTSWWHMSDPVVRGSRLVLH